MIATIVLILRFALAGILYVFLGWSLVTLWRELKQQGTKLSEQKKPGITITRKAEGIKDTQTHFTQSEIVIGRHSHCDLSLIDPALSSQHARILFHHGQWWLEDLNSTNGTLLNGTKLTTSAVIISGDEFKCGDSFFTIRIDGDDTSLTHS